MESATERVLKTESNPTQRGGHLDMQVTRTVVKWDSNRSEGAHKR